MENKNDKVGKQSIGMNEKDEQQKGNKQMLGFEDVNFEQKREPYQPKNIYRSRNPGENQERKTSSRNRTV